MSSVFKSQANNFDKFAEFQLLFVRSFIPKNGQCERLFIICPRFIVASEFSHFLIIINVNFQIPID